MIDLFREYLENGRHFAFTKFGDGEIICMLDLYQEGDTNCDKQSYSKPLSDKLWDAINFFSRKHFVYIGKWDDLFSTHFDNALSRKRIQLNYVPYATLLHIEWNDLNKVKCFYETLKNVGDKVYVCPEKLNEAKSFLNCDIVNVKGNQAFSDYEMVRDRLLKSNYSVFMYSCGLMSKVLIADILKEKPNTTHIDIGSGLDNMFLGITRSYQLDKTEIQNLYKWKSQ